MVFSFSYSAGHAFEENASVFFPVLAVSNGMPAVQLCSSIILHFFNWSGVVLYYGLKTAVDFYLFTAVFALVVGGLSYRVEHLQDAELSLLPKAIFGQIAPWLVLMTTPNVEFNVLFSNLTGFRHPDHKFEWTRKQFADW